MQQDPNGRRLTIVLAATILPWSYVCVGLLAFLPSDFARLILPFSIHYALLGLTSVLGLVGAIQQSKRHLQIFVRYLYLDAVVAAVPRILLLIALSEYREGICAAPDVSVPAEDAPENNLSQLHIGVLSFHHLTLAPGRCATFLWTAQVLLTILVIVMTALQLMLASRIREHVRAIQQGPMLPQTHVARYSDEIQQSSLPEVVVISADAGTTKA